MLYLYINKPADQAARRRPQGPPAGGHGEARPDARPGGAGHPAGVRRNGGEVLLRGSALYDYCCLILSESSACQVHICAAAA